MNHETDMDVVVANLTRFDSCQNGALVGCSEKEISEVARTGNGPLPAAYVCFLRRMGKHAGGFYRGTDFFYPQVLKLNSWGRELLQCCGTKLQLRNSDFVFSMHQGYQFLFFSLTSGDDPPVFQYLEGASHFSQIFSSFSRFLIDTSLQRWRRDGNKG